MKMQLTDKELREAVHNYVNDVVGINLADKKMTVTFSATRLEGIVTSLDIVTVEVNRQSAIVAASAPAAIPGYTTEQPDVTAVDAPAAAEPVVDPGTPEVAAAKEAEATLGDPVQVAETVVTSEPVVATTVEPTATTEPTEGELAQEPVADTTPAPKTTATLFGKPTPTAAG